MGSPIMCYVAVSLRSAFSIFMPQKLQQMLSNKQSYQKLLLDPRWQIKRVEALLRDKFTCQLCGDTRTTLHVHHTEYKGNPWEIPADKLKTLCAHCHDVTHYLKEYTIEKIDKQIAPYFKCWNMVVYTDNQILFLYLFFSKGDEHYAIQTNQIITILTDLQP